MLWVWAAVSVGRGKRLLSNWLKVCSRSRQILVEESCWKVGKEIEFEVSRRQRPLLHHAKYGSFVIVHTGEYIRRFSMPARLPTNRCEDICGTFYQSVSVAPRHRGWMPTFGIKFSAWRSDYRVIAGWTPACPVLLHWHPASRRLSARFFVCLEVHWVIRSTKLKWELLILLTKLPQLDYLIWQVGAVWQFAVAVLMKSVQARARSVGQGNHVYRPFFRGNLFRRFALW